VFHLSIYLSETVPLKVLQFYASISGNKKLRKQVDLMQDLSTRMFKMQSIFFHFLNNLWRFQLGNTDRAWALMSDRERKDFKIDVTAFSWDDAFFNYIFGLRRFYFKEDVLAPEAKFQQLL